MQIRIYILCSFCTSGSTWHDRLYSSGSKYRPMHVDQELYDADLELNNLDLEEYIPSLALDI